MDTKTHDTNPETTVENDKVKKVFLLGSTGGVGLWTAHYLLEQGYEVSTVARNQDKLVGLFEDRASDFKKVHNYDLE